MELIGDLFTGLQLPTSKLKVFGWTLVSLTVLSFIILLAEGSVLAQESEAIQISPAVTEINLDPGETALLENFVINNPSTLTEDIDVVPRDVIMIDERGSLSLTEDRDDRYSLTEWISIKPEKVSLGSREHEDLEIQLAIPENAEPGGHYGAVFALTETRRTATIEGTGLGINAGVATPILLTVNGPVSTTGEIVEFKKVPFVNLGPVDFLVRFRNTGTVHYRPHGFIEIFDIFGNKTTTVPIDERLAFPETIRRLEARWNRLLLIGHYRAVATIFFGLEDERQETAEIEFWAFPYKGVLAIIGILVFLVFISRGQRWWQERHYRE